MSSSVQAPTRERLLRAARAVIEEGGYSAATVAVVPMPRMRRSFIAAAKPERER